MINAEHDFVISKFIKVTFESKMMRIDYKMGILEFVAR